MDIPVQVPDYDWLYKDFQTPAVHFSVMLVLFRRFCSDFLALFYWLLYYYAGPASTNEPFCWLIDRHNARQESNIMSYPLMVRLCDCFVFSLNYSAPVRSIVINPSVCLCVCLFADRSARNFVCRSSVAVGRSFGGDVALRYVLLVLWMTSRLALTGATLARVGSTQRRRSITRTTGAESDVYDCLLFNVWFLFWSFN